MGAPLYPTLFTHTADAIVVADAAGQYVDANPAAETLLGYRREELLRLRVADVVAREPAWTEAEYARFRDEGWWRGEVEVRRKDGTLVSVEALAAMLDQPSGRVYVSTLRDLTERKRVEAELATRAWQQTAVADLGRRAVTGTDLAVVLDEAVVTIAETLGAEYVAVLELLPDGDALRLQSGVGWRDGLVGRTVVDTGAGSLAGDALRSDEPVLITDLRTDSHSGVPPLLREHGVISGLSVVIRSSDQPYGVLAAYAARPRAFSATDGTFLRAVANVLAAAIARERAEAARREARLHALIEHAADMVSIVDPDSTIRYVSPAIEAALGYAPAELIGTQRGLMVHLEDAARGHAAFAAALTEPGPRPPVELRVQHKDGSWRWIEVRFTNLLADPAVAGIVINSRDVTERKRVETQLQHLAVHDALTDLPNRSLFLDRLGHALTTADRHHTAVAVLLLDLDRFKAVNDQLGHIAGDRLLVTVGQRLAAGLRPGDTLARLGGDEFAVLIEDLIDPADAGRRAAQLLGVLGEPVLIDGQEREVVVGASIGCALSAPGQVTPEALLHDADVALYRAKAAGTGQWVVFEPGMNHRATERLAVEGELRRALAGDELVLHYQPKVHLASGRLVGVEGLVRWRHPTRGLLPAAEFVGLAEETGLIVPLGRWVRTEVCRQARAWWDGDPQLADLTVCVNLAVRELRPEVVAEIAHLLVETRLPPTALMLEITERGMVAETEALRTMRALQQLGVGLAIDDFGTGYSGLSYLRHLPVDAIKIDQSFVTGVGQDPRNAAVLEAVTTLGHALGLEVVAEGIETAADLAVVKGSGIEVGQGYYFARPLPAEDLVTWVSDGAGRPG